MKALTFFTMVAGILFFAASGNSSSSEFVGEWEFREQSAGMMGQTIPAV